uniref:Uncharacterized protein n=1 Tax=Phasianus colchicus TaxID=9054 RepID=A0A669QH45_PHACC
MQCCSEVWPDACVHGFQTVVLAQIRRRGLGVLSRSEARKGKLHRRLKIVGEKCAANLGLTNGFQMAVRYPPSGPSDYRTRLLDSGWPSVGPASWLRCLPRRCCCTRTDRHRMDFTCRPSV